MLIVKVIGGLGNQMFQYAFFYSLIDRGLSAKLDISDFDKYTLHNGFELNNIFSISKGEYLAKRNEIFEIKDTKRRFRERKLIGKLIFKDSNKLINKSHVIEQNYSSFYPEFYKVNNAYLEGYWQNEEYFIGIKDKIISEFSWKNITKINEDLAIKMSRNNSVAVHIRRLDQPKSFKEFLYRIRLSFVWRTCSKSYYLDSIKKIEELVENPFFYIFTDNINWVEKNIKLDSNFMLIDWNRGKDSNQDMYLMSQCKHNIISMSSFSWWGAWLNSNKDKIVIAPKKWALRFAKNEIIPKNWIRI